MYTYEVAYTVYNRAEHLIVELDHHFLSCSSRRSFFLFWWWLLLEITEIPHYNKVPFLRKNRIFGEKIPSVHIFFFSFEFMQIRDEKEV